VELVFKRGSSEWFWLWLVRLGQSGVTPEQGRASVLGVADVVEELDGGE
jgi:hypothetical protein